MVGGAQNSTATEDSTGNSLPLYESDWVEAGRGRDYIVYRNELTGEYRQHIYPGPIHTWDGSRWVSYVFENKGDYLQVRHPIASVRFYPDRTEFYVEDFSEVRIEDERWAVECWQGVNWQDAGLSGATISYEIFDEDEIRLVRTGQTGAGMLKQTYTFTRGSPIKISVEFTASQDARMRFAWRPSGIAATREVKGWAQIAPAKYDVFGVLIENARMADARVSFLDDENRPKASLAWANEIKAVDDISLSLEPHPRGRKAAITFGEFDLRAGETAILDPNVMIPPNADTFVDSIAPEDRYSDEIRLSVGMNPGVYEHRAFLRFSISDLPEVTLTSGKLWLCQGEQAFVAGDIEAREVTDDSWNGWDDWITWNTQPAYGDLLATKFIADYNHWYSWNVVSFVQSELLGDKTVSLCMKASGSVSAWFYSKDASVNHPYLEVTYDETPPTGSITINDDATYTTSTSVTLTLSASDPESGVSQMRFSNNATTWTGWETYATSKDWTLTSGDGTKTVYVEYKNGAGLSSQYSDDIILDTTPPTGSITINDGATYTASTSVTLTLSASDPESGVSQMRFSNNATTWTGWETYATSKDWTLTSGDGTKTVYVEYKNGAGLSSQYSDDIILDTTPPTAFDLLSPANNSSTSDTTPTFSWQGSSDSQSGLAGYDLYIDGSWNKSVGPTITSTTPSSSLSLGAHPWYVVAKNNVGLTTQSTSTFIILVEPVFGREPTSDPLDPESDEAEKERFESAFPNLVWGEWRITADHLTPGYTPGCYNCIAWSVGIEGYPVPGDPNYFWIWHQVDSYSDTPNGEVEVSDFDSFYAAFGYTEVADLDQASIILYVTSDGEPQHAARRHGSMSGSGDLFESKCGEMERISHEPEQLVGDIYGSMHMYQDSTLIDAPWWPTTVGARDAVAADGQITVFWDNAFDAEDLYDVRYNIYYDSTPNHTNTITYLDFDAGEKIANVTPEDASAEGYDYKYTIEGLAHETTYYVGVRAEDQNGNEETNRVEVSAETLDPPLREWIRQFGSSASDLGGSVAVDDSGNVYVAGYTYGALPGQSSSEGGDVFVRKYDGSGDIIWTRQFGSSTEDVAQGVAVDDSGNVYVVGWTSGTLPGQTSSGGIDAFVRKYDGSGDEIWTRQFGTSTSDLASGGVAVDGSGNVYVAGYTLGTLPGQTSSGDFDVFVRKYDGSGGNIWTRQFGSSSYEYAYGVAVDGSGNVYVAGTTSGALPGQTHSGGFDVFVRKYDGSGENIWTKQFGASDWDFAYGVAADGPGNVYVAGAIYDALPGQTHSGGYDAFVRKYDGSGGNIWTRQFGTSSWDYTFGVVVDGSGDLYVAGYTKGALPGQTSLGDADAFVRKYDGFGDDIWTMQFGSSARDEAWGVAINSWDNVYAAGYTLGTLPEQTSSGGADVFLVKYTNSPLANFYYSPNPTTTENMIQFTDNSSGSTGAITDWFWDFGDGATSIEQNTAHQYSATGTYPVTLTVTDNGGWTDSMTKMVTVEAPIYALRKVEPSDDANVYEKYPGNNYGSSTSIWVSPHDSRKNRGFLKFDLSGIPGGVEIIEAKLHLYCWKKQYNDFDAAAYEVANDNWSENTLTWNNQPSYGGRLYTVRVTGVGWYTWEVRSFIDRELKGDEVASLCIKGAVEPHGGRAIFDSKEWSDSSMHPYLEIAYTSPSGEWTERADTTEVGGYGEAVVGTGSYIYIAKTLYATSTPQFWRYDPTANSWTDMSVAGLPTGAFRSGTALAWDNSDYIYALAGARYSDSNRRLFFRYSISGDSWTQMADTPGPQGAGDAITWSGHDGYVYALIGSGVHGTTFARYNPASNNWEARTSPPAGVEDGASLVWTGGDYLYALRGEYLETTPVQDFWRYDIVSDSWTTMTPIPENGGVSDGGSLLWVGNWLPAHADYIYALGGGDCWENPGDGFYRYIISADTWERLTSIPYPVGYYVGNRLGFADGHIYYWQGNPSEFYGGGRKFCVFEFPA